jgi:hypothetical protein
MAGKTRSVQSGDSRPAGRSVYVPPELKCFGAVGVLTQGGTGTMTESTMGMGGTNNPNKRP